MTAGNGPQPAVWPAKGSAWEVFTVFLRLGLTSFGGPVAHLGYFRSQLVQRRQWIGEAGFADLVALCQFLPGPASSQVGFGLGLHRAGPLGAVAAWTGFTLPSAALMLASAYGAAGLDNRLGGAALHGLKIVAVAVVAQAVWGMARTLAPDRTRAAIAVGAVFLVAFAGPRFGQLTALLMGGVTGLALCREVDADPIGQLNLRVPNAVGVAALALFAVLLLGSSLVGGTGGAALFGAFFGAGSLVFGGGHVVLPLLQSFVVQPGWVGELVFLSGYGAAQALPGPLFTFAAYLGALSRVGPGGIAGAVLALAALFLPGLLLLIGALPFWDQLRRRPRAQAALRGANAAVVGVLGAALYSPVWTSAIFSGGDFALVLAGFVALTVFRASPLLVVVAITASAVVISY